MGTSVHSDGSAKPHPIRFNFRRWSHRPTIHQDWGDLQDERKVSWSELFYDLFSVASTNNVTHLLIDDPTARGAGRFLLLYGIFYFIWVSHATLVNRFRFEGLVFDVLSLLHHLALLGMILGAQNFEWYARFAGSYAILRTVSCIYQAVIYFSIPRARRLAALTFIQYAIQVGLAWAAAVSSMRTFVAIAIVILALEVAHPWVPVTFPSARLPLHVEHTAERMGLMMMIFLGEGILQLGITPIANTALQYAGIGFAAVVIFSLHLIYFHISPEQHDHALRISRNRGLAFHYLHALLGAAFLLCGSGLRLTLNTYVPGGGAGGHRRSLLAMVLPGVAGPAGAGGSAGRALLAPAAADLHGALESSTDPYVPTNVAWILCAGYTAALYFMSLIRASHHFSLDKDHPIWVLSRELKLTHVFTGWWLFIFVWPLASIFIAFGAGPMHATGFLAFVCGHAIIYNLTETHITHTISSNPRYVELVADSIHHRHHSHNMAKSSSMGSLGSGAQNPSIELIKSNGSQGHGDTKLSSASAPIVSKDPDAMEAGGLDAVAAGDTEVTGAEHAAGDEVQDATVAPAPQANGMHRRSRSYRSLRALLLRKKCAAYTECAVL